MKLSAVRVSLQVESGNFAPGMGCCFVLNRSFEMGSTVKKKPVLDNRTRTESKAFLRKVKER